MNKEDEKEILTKERLKDIRETKQTDWFATLSCVLAVVGLYGKGGFGITLILTLLSVSVIRMVMKHIDDRDRWRGEVYMTLPLEHYSYGPYMDYVQGLIKPGKEKIAYMQIFAVVMAMLCRWEVFPITMRISYSLLQ